jgi:C1A family cysteine protease
MTETTLVRKYGWHRDIPDRRDRLAIPKFALSTLPPLVDLRPKFPVPCYDQGDLGSCTANALAGVVEFERLRDGATPDFVPSRLFIYYNERMVEHSIQSDSGAMLRDGIKVLAKLGACPEVLWPYKPEVFTVRPPPFCYVEANRHKVRSYQRVSPTVNGIRSALATGSPVAFGFTVYESFESPDVARTGVAPMPGRNERALGGHAVAAFGYDDTNQRLIVRNSWGPKWGQEGYFTLPYGFLEEGLADDFWQVEIVS